ncbi:putative transposase of the Rover5 hAT-like family [Lachancea nothofagi CBS 11611]|uniref:Putative transposase of the Rover5 hAT-like family n=1 Tax=Lachancea nothofagi CBS 11611 TaxID=1266666 RepID=A0A1G4J474_9SACH|nr:putative transposase of the Rover5 hAT-like family [Lachancea nothofagi CBS 11611]
MGTSSSNNSSADPQGMDQEVRRSQDQSRSRSHSQDLHQDQRKRFHHNDPQSLRDGHRQWSAAVDQPGASRRSLATAKPNEFNSLDNLGHQSQNYDDQEAMTLDPDLDSVSLSLGETMRHAMSASVALQASGVAHDNIDDLSREPSDRFEPYRAVASPRTSSTSNTDLPDQDQYQQQQQQQPQLNQYAPSSQGQFRPNLSYSGRSNFESSRTPPSNGWMNRSRFRPYFKISISGDSKVASCIYCGKEYKEGESTGNLSKHITNNHAVEYKSRERAASKESTLTSLTSKERSLRLSAKFVSELNRDSGTLASVVLITETLVPFYVVESMGWKIINGLVPDVPLIETRKAVVEKLDHYSECLNHSLKASLESSTFVSIQLYVCSRENGLRYLAVSVSYCPNIKDKERLAAMHTPELLLNNTGDPVNGHLLDVVEFNDKSSDHPLIHKGVLKILDAYNITSKVAFVTIDQLSYALGLHDALISELLSNSQSVVMQRLGNVRLTRCINSGLEIQFERVAMDLMKDAEFQHEYHKIEELVQSWESVPSLKSFAEELVKPPQFSSQENEARGVWRQVTKFLKVDQRMKRWLATSDHHNEASLVNELQEKSCHSANALELFRYFVACCSEFDKLRGSMLTDGICFLPEGVIIYYKLNHFFDMCERASKGEHIQSEEYSYLNGRADLLPEHKERVLRAVLTSKKSFQGLFEGIQNNSLFFVGAALDPSCKFEDLQPFMSEEEMNLIICHVEVTVQDYLSKCYSCEDKDASKPEGREAGQTIKRQKLDEEQLKLGSFSGSYAEWSQYKNEIKIMSRSRRGVIQWWYDRRSKYPHLFELAMSLYYTQISSNETENIFYVTEHTLKVYQRSAGRTNTQKVMLLRNRFKNFGLYNQALRFVNPSID